MSTGGSTRSDRAGAPDETRPTALVTGATGGVGGAVACRLAEDGFRVLATGRNDARLRRVADEPVRGDGKIRTVAADLCAPEGRERLYEALRELTDELSVLVLSHGVFEYGLAGAPEEERLQRVVDTNFTSRALIFTALLPELIAGRGAVFEVNSTAARGVRPNVPWYSASMVGSLSFFRNASGADGVREAVAVCSIILGRTATSMQEDVVRHEGRPYRPKTLLQPEAVASFISSRAASSGSFGRVGASGPETGHLAEVVLLPPPSGGAGEP